MFKKISLITAAAMLSVMFTGCASTAKGPVFQPEKNTDSNMGVIYVSREKALVGAMMSANIDVNGKKAAELDQGGYLAIIAPQGMHSIRVYAGLYNKTFKVNVKKKGLYLLRMEGMDVRVVDPDKEEFRKELAGKFLQKRITIP